MELLIALGLTGILLGVFFQFFTGAMKSSRKISNDTVLVTEAQLVQQFVGSKIIEAAYIFPANGVKLGTNAITKNYFRDGQFWNSSKDSFIAGFLPPRQGEVNHQFFAYYTMPRSEFIAATQGGVTLDPDPGNDNNTWVLLEYRKNEVSLPSSNVLDLRNKPDIRGGETHLVADYIQPSNLGTSTDYQMFSFDTNSQSITFSLRMLKHIAGGNDCSSALRYPKVACTNGVVDAQPTAPLQVQLVPRNFFMGSDFDTMPSSP